MQIFHNGTPIELLYSLPAVEGCPRWHVKMLFIIAQDRDIHVGPHDTISFLHTNHVRGAAWSTTRLKGVIGYGKYGETH